MEINLYLEIIYPHTHTISTKLFQIKKIPYALWFNEGKKMVELHVVH